MMARGSEGVILLISALMLISVFLSYLISVVLCVILILLIIIFRDPDVPVAPGIISPADGRILSVDRESGAIFLQIDILGKRVIRSPVSGSIQSSIDWRFLVGNKRFRWMTQDQKSLTLFRIDAPRVSVRLSTIRRSRIAVYGRKTGKVLKGDRLCLIPRSRIIRIDISGETSEIIARPGMLVLAGESMIAKI